MAKKTPLSFLIEGQSKEALKKLEEVEQKLGKLKDGIQIDIKSDSGTNLTTLLQNIATTSSDAFLG